MSSYNSVNRFYIQCFDESKKIYVVNYDSVNVIQTDKILNKIEWIEVGWIVDCRGSEEMTKFRVEKIKVLY